MLQLKEQQRDYITTCVSKLIGLKVIARLSPTTAKLAVTLGSGLGVVLTLGSNVVVVVVGAGVVLVVDVVVVVVGATVVVVVVVVVVLLS